MHQHTQSEVRAEECDALAEDCLQVLSESELRAVSGGVDLEGLIS